MKYLFIGSHADDNELSCGGLISKLVSEGHFVHVISMTESYDGVNLYDEFEASMNILGVETFQTYQFKTRCLHEAANDIADLARYWCDGFDFVFTHSCDDRHPDHRTVAEQVRRVHNGNLITFITPINGSEDPNYFVELTGEQLEKKINALWCYRSQAHRKYMDSDFIRSQAVYNGIKCGKKYAESYQIHRMIF